MWPTTTLALGLWGCGYPLTTQCAPTLFSAMASLLMELLRHAVRLLPGQPVREEDLVQNAVRCLNELRSGGMPAAGCLRGPRFGGRRGAWKVSLRSSPYVRGTAHR